MLLCLVCMSKTLYKIYLFDMTVTRNGVKLLNVILCLFVTLQILKVVNGSYVDEENILHLILKDYGVDVRPQIKPRTPVSVKFDVRLKSLNYLDIKSQELNLDVFLIMNWEDPRLSWNSSLYNDTNRVNIDARKIWTPDIVLFNRADPIAKFHTDLYTSKVLVFNDGILTWHNLVTLCVSCDFDVTWFPMDKQTCYLNFGSWSYDISQLKLSFKFNGTNEIMSDVFNMDSGEWDIDSFTSSHKDLTFSCCPHPFSSAMYTMTVSRVSLYYFMYILLPLISLAFLFLLVFHIPSDSGERMGFGVTILLSITVYLLVISEKLPEKSNDTPMLGICFITIFYVLILALSTAAGTTILSKRRSQPPQWLLNITTKGCFKIDAEELKVHKIEPVASVKYNNNSDLFEQHISEETSETKQPTEEELEEIYNRDWMKICRVVDKKLFLVFFCLIILIPIVVSLSLNKSGRV